MENVLLTVLFLCASLASLFFANIVLIKNKNNSHILHIFSIAYLSVLALREINEIITNNAWLWLVIFAGLLAMLFFIEDIKKAFPKITFFSHHHHAEFSYILAGLFILHSFVDGLLFGEASLIRSGLILHRFVDGLVIFGLFAENGYLNLRKLSNTKTVLFIIFIFAPVFGLFLPQIISSGFWVVLKNVAMFVLATLSVIDLRFEISHGHIGKNKLLATVLVAVLLGLIIGH